MRGLYVCHYIYLCVYIHTYICQLTSRGNNSTYTAPSFTDCLEAPSKAAFHTSAF